nr:hypothetical protein Iba_chr12aCG6100 [Ipomoea batatas]GMD59922.1 hypothetical protein Iba_chr12aCG6120 [Ipomoea batatas]
MYSLGVWRRTYLPGFGIGTEIGGSGPVTCCSAEKQFVIHEFSSDSATNRVQTRLIGCLRGANRIDFGARKAPESDPRNIRISEPENDPGSDPVKLLKDNITSSRFGKESKKSGMIPKTLALLALKETKLVLRFRCIGISQELRFGFSETLKLFKRGRPERKSEGTEVKSLPSKRRSSSMGMLAKEGKGPEREFPETERFMREESWVIPEKSWPEM